MQLRIELELFSSDGAGGFFSEGSIARTCSFESIEGIDFEVMLRSVIREHRSKFAPDIRFKAAVYADNARVIDLDERDSEQYMRSVRENFFAHKREHPGPTPYDQLTPLQKRMQSGGPGRTVEPEK